MIKSVYTPNALTADTHELWWVHTGSVCVFRGVGNCEWSAGAYSKRTSVSCYPVTAKRALYGI